jgi:hypothetical protein
LGVYAISISHCTISNSGNWNHAGHALPNTNNFSFSHRASDYYGYKIGQLIPDFIKKNGGEGDFWSRFANKLPFDNRFHLMSPTC